jgi:hypothetical protein
MDFPTVVSVMRQRISQDAELLKYMVAIRDRYNGEVLVPLADVSAQRPMEPPVPRLIQEAIDHTAMRANSSRPQIFCPSESHSEGKEAQATKRRRSLYGGWHENYMEQKLYRAYRHFVGYGTFSFMVMPDDKLETAVINLRDPLTTYPELIAPDDIRFPINVGYVFGRSAAWIRDRFPVAYEDMMAFAMGRDWDTLWDLVEWIDETDVVIGILGPRMPAYAPQEFRPYGYSGFEVARWPNRAGFCPCVTPRRVTLDRILGQVSTLISTTDLFARLTALDIAAAEKAIFPDVAVIGRGAAPPQLISGPWQDGRTGNVNLLTESTVQVLQSAPGPLTAPILDRLENAIRDSGGIPSLYGGQATGGARTGAGMAALGGFAVDPRIAEANSIMGRSLERVNEAYMAVMEGYYGDKHFTFFPGTPGVDETVEIVPERDYKFKANVVSYAFPGSDASQVSVAITQLVGSKIMSRATGRQKHPFIDDAQQEENNVDEEALTDAFETGLQQQLASGQGVQLPTIARTIQLLRSGRDLVDAYMQATAEDQAAQQAAGGGASMGPTPGGGPPNAGPMGPGGAPGPGGQLPPQLAAALQQMGAQGQGGSPGPPVPPPSPSLLNTRHMAQALNAQVSPGAV